MASFVLVVILCLPDYLELVRGLWGLDDFGNDFHLFYGASYMALHGDMRCYEPAVMNWYCLTLTEGRYHAWPLFQFPFFVLAFTPTAMFDLRTATMGFLVVNHLLLLASVWCLAAALGWGSTPARRIMVVATWFLLGLLFVPINDTLLRGQLNLIVLFFMALFLLSLRRGRDTTAAVALGMAILVKMVPALLLVPAAMRGLKRPVGATLGLVAGLSALAAVVAPALTVGWCHSIAARQGPTPWLGLAHPTSQSWCSVLARMFFPEAGTPTHLPLVTDNAALGTFLIFLVNAALWIGVLVLLYRHRRDGPASLLPQMALVVAAAGVGVPYNWFHHHTWLLVPLMVCWKRVLDEGILFRLPGLALWGATFCLATLDGPFYRGMLFMRYGRYWFLLWGGGAVAATFLVAVCAWLVLHPRGEAGANSPSSRDAHEAGPALPALQ